MYVDIKEVAKDIRKKLKEKIPNCTFSVRIKRYSGGQSLNISLMTAPFFVLKDKNINHIQVNHYYIQDQKYLTKEAKEVLIYVCNIVNGYNYDNSQPEVDYFDVGFYFHLEIGQWNKEFKKI